VGLYEHTDKHMEQKNRSYRSGLGDQQDSPDSGKEGMREHKKGKRTCFSQSWGEARTKGEGHCNKGGKRSRVGEGVT